MPEILSSIKLSPEWTGASQPFRHTWAPVGNVDQFRWLSRADLLRQLAAARDELGVRHVRACAMYSPEMAVWDYDLADWRKAADEKSRRANWQLVDAALEGLLELGLKPIYTTCFTPVGMTDDPAVCWPDKNTTGMPRDLKQWQEFVSGGIRHHIERFGMDEVRSWYFECWNEPNLKGCFFGGTKEDFFTLWSATWHAVKSVDPALRFGGPSTARGEWLPDFLDWTAKDGTPPDYLITHVYNNDSDGEPLSPFDGPASHKVKDSPHFASGVIRGLRRELARRGWPGEVHWNEWGRSWFLSDPKKESPLEAAFIVKTMAEVSQEADAFAFWCLSDIYNQGGFESSEFQGNYGMMSLHGLRKPAWFAHQLLNGLGSSRVPVSGGNDLINAVATRAENGAFRLLAYAYPGGIDDAPGRVALAVGLPPGARAIRLTRIGSVENNILAAWRELGSPAYPTAAQLAVLQAANRLQESPASAVRMENGSAFFEIERPGVALLEFLLI
jgi:xylan 1,4-beta-xylosidase